ncbi:hypothetical protein [Leifsonia sp. SIMBA_070]|uniref:hypothetical protein n=1 Tax=Leifsonia sp. SIMBA_070 TaxID=3085810 RepID=UPI00397A6888
MTLLPVGPEAAAEVLTFPSPDGTVGPPQCIRRSIGTPDGEMFEVWDLAERTGDSSATYRLTRIVARE